MRSFWSFRIARSLSQQAPVRAAGRKTVSRSLRICLMRALVPKGASSPEAGPETFCGSFLFMPIVSSLPSGIWSMRLVLESRLLASRPFPFSLGDWSLFLWSSEAAGFLRLCLHYSLDGGHLLSRPSLMIVCYRIAAAPLYLKGLSTSLPALQLVLQSPSAFGSDLEEVIRL